MKVVFGDEKLKVDLDAFIEAVNMNMHSAFIEKDKDGTLVLQLEERIDWFKLKKADKCKQFKNFIKILYKKDGLGLADIDALVAEGLEE